MWAEIMGRSKQHHSWQATRTKRDSVSRPDFLSLIRGSRENLNVVTRMALWFFRSSISREKHSFTWNSEKIFWEVGLSTGGILERISLFRSFRKTLAVVRKFSFPPLTMCIETRWGHCYRASYLDLVAYDSYSYRLFVTNSPLMSWGKKSSLRETSFPLSQIS
jgi:hypothetical protein